MKKLFTLIFTIISATIFFGCSSNSKDITLINLSDDIITVNDQAISTSYDSVYMDNDIIFYLEDQGFKYGEGTESDEHSQEEADAHSVIYITQPGDYKLTGSLSLGQIAIDLGDEAKDDPTAVVNLYLDNVDITCKVAPAIIFYNVYECGSDDENEATYDVDTSNAGANVYIVDDSINNLSGSYVARIYKSIVLNEEGTEVIDNEKLHKYDGALYSKQTMNLYGEKKDNGILNIVAENEGLDTELHLTINGGNINITSGNDGINTNEDGISVTTINGGNLNIQVEGQTGEGDGIDSNGWLVINGGTVISAAYSHGQDAGIDSDMGIYINGGTVIASGNMLDRILEGNQNSCIFNFNSSQKGGSKYTFKAEDGTEIITATPANDFTCLIISTDNLKSGNYTLYNEQLQLGHSGAGPMGNFGNRMDIPPEDINHDDLNRPEDFEFKEGETREFPTDGKEPKEFPTGKISNRDIPKPNIDNAPPSFDESYDKINNIFQITGKVNTFYGISKYTETN